MKKLLLVLMMLPVVGCDSPATNGKQEVYKVNQFDVAIIDGCEYIVSYGYANCPSYSHKGNCKNHKPIN